MPNAKDTNIPAEFLAECLKIASQPNRTRWTFYWGSGAGVIVVVSKPFRCDVDQRLPSLSCPFVMPATASRWTCSQLESAQVVICCHVEQVIMVVTMMTTARMGHARLIGARTWPLLIDTTLSSPQTNRLQVAMIGLRLSSRSVLL
jgi:hypothetical protein